MQIIEEEADLFKVSNNYVYGQPKMIDSKIIFNGNNNILFCEDGVVLENSYIRFSGNNSLIFLRKSTHKYRLCFKVFNNSTIYIDQDNYFNEPLNAIISEECNLLIGKDCMFSTGISMMTSDAHLIYDMDTLERINYSKSIYIGDHIWIGQDVTILKNCRIDSGSIIGASSVVPGIEIKNNSIYCGNPAKMVKDRTFWNGACVLKWTKPQTEISSRYDTYLSDNTELNTNDFIYEYNYLEELTFNDIENYLINIFI